MRTESFVTNDSQESFIFNLNQYKDKTDAPNRLEADKTRDEGIGACSSRRDAACADPEIFMRGGPTKIVIFGHRRGGVQPSKNPEITFF